MGLGVGVGVGVGLGVAQAGVTHSLVVRAKVAEGEIEARSREMGARSLLGPAQREAQVERRAGLTRDEACLGLGLGLGLGLWLGLG